MRRLRLAASTQFGLVIPGLASTPAQRWSGLPDRAQATALSLLARMIANGVVAEDEVGDGGDD